MKKLKIDRSIECMNCLACSLACSSTWFKVDDPDKATLKIVPKTKDDTQDTKPMVCVQCGKCAEACPEHAITQNKMDVYMINKKLCVGCGKCVEACPFGVCRKPEDSEVAFKCIVCGKCVEACPMDILSIAQ